MAFFKYFDLSYYKAQPQSALLLLDIREFLSCLHAMHLYCAFQAATGKSCSIFRVGDRLHTNEDDFQIAFQGFSEQAIGAGL